MQANRRLSEILPVHFRNGGQVRQFSKPCTHCGQMLNASHMNGVAKLVNDHIAIAARAHCPTCGETFAVTCLISPDKRVRRVVLPYWLFNPYIRMLKDEQPVFARDKTTIIAPVPAAEPEPVLPVEVECAEEAVGRYQGKPIPAWVRVNGKQFAFERIAPEARTAAEEFLLDGCLVYRLQA